MSFFSKVGGALKSVAKVAALPVTAPLKFQAKVGSQLLSTIARKIPTPFNIGGSSSSAPPAAPPPIYGQPPGTSAPLVGWRGMSLPTAASSPVSYGPAPTPVQQSFFPAIASAVSNLPAAPAPSPLLPNPGYPMPAPEAPSFYPSTSGSYGPPPNLYPQSAGPSDNWDGGGYGQDGGGGDDGGYDYTQGEGGDREELGDIDYAAHFAQLGDWKSDLLNVAKGAASGALSAGANALTGGAKSAAAVAAAAKAKADAGMSLPVKLAIGAAIALPVGYLLLHRGHHEEHRARNPRRKKRSRRSNYSRGHRAQRGADGRFKKGR